MSYMIYDIMLTRASLAILVGKVDFALSGAAELGVERVHVHVHILTGKESKYVPSIRLLKLINKHGLSFFDFQLFY